VDIEASKPAFSTPIRYDTMGKLLSVVCILMYF